MAQLAPRQKATALQTLVRGVAVGFVATQVLDLVSCMTYEWMSEEDRIKEDTARSGHQAYEKMVMQLSEKAGLELTEKQIKYWGWKFHRSFGILGGIQFMALREKFPAAGAGLGIPFGLGFFVLADEIMIAATGAVPPPQAFGVWAHVRGAIDHVAYGIAAELTAKSFDKIAEYENGVGWALEEDKGKPKLQDAREPRITKSNRTSAKEPSRARRQRTDLESATSLS